MTPDLRILAREAVDFGLGEAAAEAGVELAWELLRYQHNWLIKKGMTSGAYIVVEFG